MHQLFRAIATSTKSTHAKILLFHNNISQNVEFLEVAYIQTYVKKSGIGRMLKSDSYIFRLLGVPLQGVVRMGGTLYNVLWLIVLRGVYRRTTFLSCILIFHLLDNIYIYYQVHLLNMMYYKLKKEKIIKKILLCISRKGGTPLHLL